MVIPQREQWHRFEGLMFRICFPSSTRKEKRSSTAKKSSIGHDSSLSSTTATTVTTDRTTFTTTGTTASASVTNSRESRDSKVSSASSSSSLAGIRELLPDGPIRYRHRELASATENFSEAFKVGGSVFRASVRGADVAIVLKKGTFVANYIELIRTISSVHHVNLVKMLGACLREGTEFVYVCYEYEEGVNLSEALRSSKVEGFSALSRWTSRVQVAVDVALGLEYLHDHTMPTFVHKHVKSSNILVGNALRAKIAKFGVAQLVGEVPPPVEDDEGKKVEVTEEEEDRPSSRRKKKLVRKNSIKITGTPGYMSPEYQNRGVVSSKMDVYAFGVVLLELLTGKQPGVQLDPVTKKLRVVSLTDEVIAVMDEPDPRKKLRLWIDARLRDSYPIDVAMSIAALARACIDANPDSRPPMKNVAAKLTNYLSRSQEWDKDFLAFREMQSQTMEGR